MLPNQEMTFWKELIEKYLKPIDADKQKEVGALHLYIKVFTYLLCIVVMCFYFLATYYERTSRLAGPSSILLFHVKCHFRPHCVSHAVEQRPAAFKMAFWY